MCMPVSYHISSWLLSVATEQKMSIGFTQLPYCLIFFKQFLELALNDAGTSLQAYMTLIFILSMVRNYKGWRCHGLQGSDHQIEVGLGENKHQFSHLWAYLPSESVPHSHQLLTCILTVIPPAGFLCLLSFVIGVGRSMNCSSRVGQQAAILNPHHPCSCLPWPKWVQQKLATWFKQF
jgi:hypothetical protein